MARLSVRVITARSATLLSATMRLLLLLRVARQAQVSVQVTAVLREILPLLQAELSILQAVIRARLKVQVSVQVMAVLSEIFQFPAVH